jgi:4-hydroxybenzoate polyprenyltransferase
MVLKRAIMERIAMEQKQIAPSKIFIFKREIYVTWLFIVSNIGATIIPGVVFSVAAMHSLRQAVNGIDILKAIIYFFFYVYVFDLSNQYPIKAVREDTINKPRRPIVAGLISARQTKVRFIIAMMIYLVLGIAWGVAGWTLLWQMTVVWHNLYNGSRWWVTKNTAMALGIIAQLGAGWQLIGPLTSSAWIWIIFLAITNFWIVNIQDMRDVVGDRMAERRTFIVLYGEQKTRYLLALSFILMPVLTHFVCYWPLGNTWQVLLSSVISNTLLIVVAIRLMFKRDTHSDHRSYQLYIYWYCVFLASGIILL